MGKVKHRPIKRTERDRGCNDRAPDGAVRLFKQRLRTLVRLYGEDGSQIAYVRRLEREGVKMDPSTLSNWINHAKSVTPQINVVKIMCEISHVSSDWLLGLKPATPNTTEEAVDIHLKIIKPE